MFKFKVITDSTTGLTQEEIKDLDVTVLPLTLSYDGKDYRDGVDINTDDFYDMVFKSQEKKGLKRFDFLGLLKRDSKEFPKTSMVSPGVFAEAYEKILAKGYIPVVFTITRMQT